MNAPTTSSTKQHQAKDACLTRLRIDAHPQRSVHAESPRKNRSGGQCQEVSNLPSRRSGSSELQLYPSPPNTEASRIRDPHRAACIRTPPRDAPIAAVLRAARGGTDRGAPTDFELFRRYPFLQQWFCSQCAATHTMYMLPVMRPWGSFSRHCEACYTNAARRVVARRHASSRSKVEVAREEHAENVRWSKQPEARGVLEQPRFDVDGAAAKAGALDSLDAYLEVCLFVSGAVGQPSWVQQRFVPTVCPAIISTLISQLCLPLLMCGRETRERTTSLHF